MADTLLQSAILFLAYAGLVALMFSNLSQRLTRVLRDVTGRGRLTEDNIKDTLREIRMALLEADVSLPVVRDFTAKVRDKAIGADVMQSLSPGQALVKIVYDELVSVMGDANNTLDLAAKPPVIILVAGLQGSGKTTSVAKLGRWLKERQKKTVAVVSCDVYRPAAIEQLKTLAHEVGLTFFHSDLSQDPIAIASAAVASANAQLVDVLIVDTAGRLHVDAEMMDEVKRIHAAIVPTETLFVVDSMAGQDAANTAKAFHEALPLTGVILTKADGDARGGAALSIRHITGKPIKFIGVGEKTTALEPFHPDRIASRILGMGDVLSLVEEVQHKVDQEKAEKFAQKLKKGGAFTLEDFREQLQQLTKMGGMAGMMDKLPGMSQVPDQVKAQINDKELIRMIAMVNSMTPAERRNSDIIKASRRKRIAMGSGTQVQDVNRMLKQFIDMQRMMKQFSKGGLHKMMRAMRGRVPGMKF